MHSLIERVKFTIQWDESIQKSIQYASTLKQGMCI
jgi:hypothetical protein